MDLRSLKVLFSDGGLNAAIAMKASPEKKGWLLHFQRRSGGVTAIGTVREPEIAKIFRSLDAVASAAADVGFTQVLVKFTEGKEEISPKDSDLKVE